MKRTHYLASIVALLAGLYGLSSCTAVQEDAPQGLFTEEVSFVVNLDEMPVTKTVNNGNSTVWGEEDRITIINHDINSEDDDFRSGYLTHRGNNEFGGRIGALSGDMFNWYFVYPYRSDNKSPKEISISVESNPTQDGNGDNKMAHLAGEGFPLYGKVTNSPKNANIPAIYMVQVLSRLDYKVTNATSNPIVVKEVEFSAPAAICGDFTGNLTVDTPVWTAESDASKVLKLSVENGKEIAAGGMEEYFAGFVPFKLEAGKAMQVKITAVNPSNPNSNLVYYKVYKFDDDVTFRAGQFNSFNLSFDPANSDTPVSDDPIVNPDDPTPGEPSDQILSFSYANVTWTIGSGYAIGSSYPVQELSGAHTEVTYGSSNTNVATVNGSTITIVGAGQTLISASAKATSEYKSAYADYTLTIVDQSTPQPTTAIYQKVTAEPSNWEGTYLFVDESSSKAFATVGNVTGYAASVTINSDYTITSNSTVDQYALTVVDAGVTHANVSGQEAYDIKNTNNKYVFYSSSEIQLLDTNEKTAGGGSSSTLYTYHSALKYSNGGVQVISSGHSSGFSKYYLGYSDNVFTYSGGQSATSSDEARRVQLYKLVNGSTSGKQIQNLSFAQSTVTWTLGSGYSIGSSYDPQASGAKTTVSYTSSDTNVAVIENNKIVIKGAGQTTITANALADATYEAASKSYTLIVREASSTPTGQDVYIKVTAEPENWAGTYLFVDESSSKAFAAFSANSSSYAVNVTISNGEIVATSDINKYAITVTDAGMTHGNSNANGREAYNVKNSDGKYLYASSGSIQISDSNSRTSSGSTYTYYHSFWYNNNGVQVLSANTSSSGYAYYFGYSSSAFGYAGGSNASTSDEARRIQLYKLVQGGGSTTPTDPTKIDQNLSFAQSTVTLNMESATGTTSVQVPSGAQTTVTYTSSNTNVATINGNTINIVGFGQTIITANAEGNSQYNAASLSYTLNINQTGSSTPTTSTRTYTYQTSVSAGTYLLGGYESSGSQYSIALFPTVITGNWESSQGSVTNGQYIGQRDIDSSTTLTYTNDSEIFNAEVELIASGSNWKIKVKSTGQYLVVPTADNRIVYTDSESSATAFSISGSGSGSTWGGSTSGNGMGVSSGSYYFYHSSSAHGFSMRAYQVTNIRLYKLTSEGGSSSTQQNQPLSFNQSAVSISMNTYPAGSTYTGQSVSGSVGSVTYTSANTNVATVSGNGSNPTFTIKGPGSTTITANAAASGNYAATSLSYTLTVTEASSTPSTGDATYVKATSLTVGGTYLIVSEDDTKLFKGASDGSYVTINPSNGVITDANNAYSGYEFTVTQSGSKYCIQFNDNKYLLCDYSTSGNSTTGLVYESSQPSSEYLYSLTVTGERFEFMTAQRNSSSTSEVLYYKPESMGGTGADKFKIGGSGAGIGVHLYLKTSNGSGKKAQSPYFSQGSVTQAMETASGTMTVQTLQNAVGNVTYTSSNTNVASISGTTITIKGFGSVTITGTAAGNDEYYSGSATYTLNINRVSQEGVYNLENDCVYNYLNEATSTYTAANHSSTTLINSSGGGWSWGGGSSSSSGVYSFNGVNYTPSSSDRWDCPKPVTITWSTALSGNKSVYVYTDAAHTQQVDYIENPQTVSSSTNSADIYNLIPGITYYYVVRSGSSDVASGDFTTEGRRRMMRISTNYSQDHANNCRDLGGQITSSGKRIKYGKIYRGSNMDQTTTDEQKILKQYMKIGLDVDLRGSDRKNALNLANDIPARTSSNHSEQTYEGHTNESYNSSSDLRNSDQRMGATLTRIMLAVHNNVNVYVHCMVGADRTGFTCMMIEAILGVPLERCDMDYEMTSFSVVGTRPRNSSSISHYNDGVSAVNGRSGNTYQDKAIDYAVNYFGVDRDLITQFQNDMLE